MCECVLGLVNAINYLKLGLKCKKEIKVIWTLYIAQWRIIEQNVVRHQGPAVEELAISRPEDLLLVFKKPLQNLRN